MSSLLLFKHMGGITGKEEFMPQYCPDYELYWIPQYIPNDDLNLICLNANLGSYALTTSVCAYTYETLIRDEYNETSGRELEPAGAKLMAARKKALEEHGFINVCANAWVRKPNQNKQGILQIYTIMQRYEMRTTTCGALQLQIKNQAGSMTAVDGAIIESLGHDPLHQAVSFDWVLHQAPDRIVYVAKHTRNHYTLETP